MHILIDTKHLVVERMFRSLKLNITSILYLVDLIAQFSGVARPRPRGRALINVVKVLVKNILASINACSKDDVLLIIL